MIKLVASDLDGTILDNSLSIPKENLKAINEIKKANIPFVICTGKTYAISKNICKTLNADYGIFGNGSQIVDLKTGKEIAKHTISIDDIKTCYNIAQKHNLHFHAYTSTSVITSKLEFMDLRAHLMFPDSINFKFVNSVMDYIEINKPDTLKVCISSTFDLSNLKYLLKMHSNLSITHISRTGIYKDTVINKEYEYLDITAINITKGTALQQLGNYLKIKKSDILSIGDNINDIDMFRVSGIGATVNNAYNEVKKEASFISSKSAENSGFAETIYKFIPIKKNQY